ncbi:MAG: hypothetical protein U9R42_10860 [Bacteroidota bacterium]|nr:hypothetical protein [Bacteroidota bacterium]
MYKKSIIYFCSNLLGYENIKTTEIYTHITSKELDLSACYAQAGDIDNPMDDMDL